MLEFMDSIRVDFKVEKFFNIDNLVKFIHNHSWTNKKLLITHLNSILSQTANFSGDIRSSVQCINLTSRLEFKRFMVKGKMVKTSGGFTDNHVKEVIRLHKSSNSNTKDHLITCYIFCQLSLGIRFNNVAMLNDKQKYIIKEANCTKCRGKLCDPVTQECFKTLKFHKSKTGEYTCFIIPAAQKCLIHLANSGSKTLNLKGYNGWLKQNLDNNLSSHHIRKFITNLCILNRNTGNWKQKSNITNHYISDYTKFADLQYYLDTTLNVKLGLNHCVNNMNK